MPGKTRRGKGGGLMDLAKAGIGALKEDYEDDEGSSPTTVEGYKNQLGMLTGEVGKLKGMLGTGGRTTRRNKASGGDIVSHLLTIRNQVKLYHWQTKQFARHKATDDLTAALDTAIDSFVESYMGRYGRPKVSGSIKLHNFSESAAKKFVANETKYLETDLPRKIGKGDSDLLNIRDEILAELTKVSYLFTLQ
jgi:hypothetical protein